jgi:zinc transporter 7
VIDSLAIFVGFGAFFVMEKTLRVLGGDDDEHGHGHGHSHSHSHPEKDAITNGTSSAVSRTSSADTIRPRNVGKSSKIAEHDSTEEEEENTKVVKTSKLSAYLNLFGDFVHNMCVSFATTESRSSNAF